MTVGTMAKTLFFMVYSFLFPPSITVYFFTFRIFQGPVKIYAQIYLQAPAE